MVSAIEIYNKPRIAYRNEVFTILLVNAWELALKAVLSKAGRRIYYPKKPNEPYRSYSLRDAFHKASATPVWPSSLDKAGVGANLELLVEYRDAAVHLYNAKGFDVVVYGLAQTCILNFNDLLREVFGTDLSDEVTWKLLPLGIEPPISAIDYLGGPRPEGSPGAVDAFIQRLSEEAESVEKEGGDTGRVFTAFDVALQSVKKIESADVVVGVSGEDPANYIVQRPLDPNKSHPLSATEAVERIADKRGSRFSMHDFIVAVWHYNLRGDSRYWWQNNKGNVTQWSHDVVNVISRLPEEELTAARQAYRENQRTRARR